MEFNSEMAEKILIYIAMVMSLGLHEAAHAKVAKFFGDSQPAEDGVDTWNPIPHIRRALFTCVLLPAITWFLSGFFIGGAFVRLNPMNMKPRRLGYALSVAAGPGMNLLISFLMLFFAILTGIFLKQKAAMGINVLLYIGAFNLLLFVFNLLPAPPLDGASILQTIFPQTERFFQTAGRFLFFGLLILLQFSDTAANILFYPFYQYYYLASDLIQSVMNIIL
ncbi:MAG: site-2 protease family protein [Spirochaetales bacterium]|nr:site-2 protease family protein [Spirochaetales bacterium]